MAQCLVVVEDPDAPLPRLVVHGIYYTMPSNKTTLQPEELQKKKRKLRMIFSFKLASLIYKGYLTNNTDNPLELLASHNFWKIRRPCREFL